VIDPRFLLTCSWCGLLVDLGRAIADGLSDADCVLVCEICTTAIARMAATVEAEVERDG
jgi:hypothetical protein